MWGHGRIGGRYIGREGGGGLPFIGGKMVVSHKLSVVESKGVFRQATESL